MSDIIAVAATTKFTTEKHPLRNVNPVFNWLYEKRVFD
jgi:hypothetical protein